MLTRSREKIWTFSKPFILKGVDRELPAGSYRVATDEELIEGPSFPAYRRVATLMFVPGPNGSSVEMVTIDPAELQTAQERDAAGGADLRQAGQRHVLLAEHALDAGFAHADAFGQGLVGDAGAAQFGAQHVEDQFG